MRTTTLILAGLLLFGACGQTPARSPQTPRTIDAPVVYGGDDRTEWYAFDDEAVRTLTRHAAAAMVNIGDIHVDDDGIVSLDSTTLQRAHTLCADQRFLDQPSPGSCSGTLIDHNLLLTAGHCVTTASDCDGKAWVFDLLFEADGVLAEIDTDDVYRCVDIVTNGFFDTEQDIDFSIVQLDRSVVGRTPAPVAARGPTEVGDNLIMLGFPNGIPLKIDAGGVVFSPRVLSGDYFVASVDAFNGNSGSGVLNSDLEIVGVLTDGEEDYENLGSCSIVNVVDPDDAEESVVYAFQAVKSLCDKGYPSAALCAIAPTCGDGFCTDDDTLESCPADCDGLFAVPTEWTCNRGFYGVGDGCDCDCGALDPDCGGDAEVYGCAPGGTCQADGTCTASIPDVWTCRTRWYDGDDGCDCDCGARDPDCDRPDQGVFNCQSGSACNADGACEVPIPEGWTCSAAGYDRNNGCHCGCGIVDPDCENPAADVIGCAPGSACAEDGTCVDPIPDRWICNDDFYGVGDDCDCNCGAYDPDCDDVSLRLVNCTEGLVCGAGGGCVDPDDVVAVEEADGVEEIPDVVEPGDTAASDTTGATDTGPADTGGGDGLSDDTGATKVYAAQGGGGCAGGGAPSGWPLLLLLCIIILVATQRRRPLAAHERPASEGTGAGRSPRPAGGGASASLARGAGGRVSPRCGS